MENPDDRLHIVGIHGLVGVFEINPTADVVDVPLPLSADVANIILAGGDEFIDAQGLDFFLAVDAQLFLDFVFGGETVTVPTPNASDALALHGLVTGNDVFDDTTQEVAIMG